MSPSKLQVSSSFEPAGGLQRLTPSLFSSPTNHLRYLLRHSSAVRLVLTPFTVLLQESAFKAIEAADTLATKSSACPVASLPLTVPTPSLLVRFGRTE